MAKEKDNFDFFNKDIQETMQELADSNHKLVREQSYWRSFGRGVITGLGASVGAVLVLALVGTILRHLITVDFIRPAVEAVLPYVDGSVKVKTPESTATVYPSPSPSPSPSPTPEVIATPSPESTP